MTITAKPISEILLSMTGEFNEQKLSILISEANKLLYVDDKFTGVETTDGHVYGSSEGKVIAWREFANLKVNVGYINI